MAAGKVEKYKSDGSLGGNALEWVDARFPARDVRENERQVARLWKGPEREMQYVAIGLARRRRKLVGAGSLPLIIVAFFGLGAAASGFQMSTQTMVLEYGAREDVPMRLALSGTAQGIVSTIGPLVGGLLAASAGYLVLLGVSIAFEAIALILLVSVVDEPRWRTRPR